MNEAMTCGSPVLLLLLLAVALLGPGCAVRSYEDGPDDDDATDDDDDDDDDACPIDAYPVLSPDCELFVDNPIDGIQPVLNRTTACSDPPPLGQPAAPCWDDGPTGYERYLGFCINLDDLGVCTPGHLGPDDSGEWLEWDDQLDCIDGEVSVTSAGAKTCLPLCVGQGDEDVGAACAGGRECIKTNTDAGEQVVCGG